MRLLTMRLESMTKMRSLQPLEGYINPEAINTGRVKLFVCSDSKKPVEKQANKYDSGVGGLTLEEALGCLEDGLGVGLLHHHGGLLVIDVDLPKAGREWRDGPASLANLEQDSGFPFSRLPYVGTPSGGRHYYFSVDDTETDWGAYIIEATKPDGPYPGLEIRHPGMGDKYVMLPGSYGKYQWVQPAAEYPPGVYRLPKEVLAPWRIRGASASQVAPTVKAVNNQIIRNALEVLDPTDYDTSESWKDILFAVNWTARAISYNVPNAEAIMEDAFAAFDEWSDRDPRYAGETEERRIRWDSLGHNDGGREITIGTLKWEVKEALLKNSVNTAHGGVMPTGVELSMLHQAVAVRTNSIFQISEGIKGTIAKDILERLEVPVFQYPSIHAIVKRDVEIHQDEMQEKPHGETDRRDIFDMRSRCTANMIEVIQLKASHEADALEQWTHFSEEYIRAVVSLKSSLCRESIGSYLGVEETLVPDSAENAFITRNRKALIKQLKTLYDRVGRAARGGMTEYEHLAYKVVEAGFLYLGDRIVMTKEIDAHGVSKTVTHIFSKGDYTWKSYRGDTLGSRSKDYLSYGLMVMKKRGSNISKGDLVAGGHNKDGGWLAPKLSQVAIASVEEALIRFENPEFSSFLRPNGIEAHLEDTASRVLFSGSPQEARPKPHIEESMQVISCKNHLLQFVPTKGVVLHDLEKDPWVYPVTVHVDQEYSPGLPCPWHDYAYQRLTATSFGELRPDMHKDLLESFAACLWPGGSYKSRYIVLYGRGNDGKTSLINTTLKTISDIRSVEKADNLIEGKPMGENIDSTLLIRAKEASHRYMLGARSAVFADHVKNVTEEDNWRTVDNKYAARRVIKSPATYVMDTNTVPAFAKAESSVLRRVAYFGCENPLAFDTPQQEVTNFEKGLEVERQNGSYFSKLVDVFHGVLLNGYTYPCGDAASLEDLETSTRGETIGDLVRYESPVHELLKQCLVSRLSSGVSFEALSTAINQTLRSDLQYELTPQALRNIAVDQTSIHMDIPGQGLRKFDAKTGERVQTGFIAGGCFFDLDLASDEALSSFRDMTAFESPNFQLERPFKTRWLIGGALAWTQD